MEGLNYFIDVMSNISRTFMVLKPFIYTHYDHDKAKKAERQNIQT